MSAVKKNPAKKLEIVLLTETETDTERPWLTALYPGIFSGPTFRPL